MSLREKLSRLPRVIEQVTLEDVGETVHVWGMTAREKSEFERQFVSGKTGKTIEARTKELRERLLAWCLRNMDGSPIYDGSSSADLSLIGDLPASVAEPFVNVSMRLCGFSGADVESLTKNSDETSAV